MARNPHPEVTERRILAAAKKLFAEKGYDKTSIQDIIDNWETCREARSTTTSSPKRPSSND